MKRTVDGHELVLVHENYARRVYEYSGPAGSIQYFEVLQKVPLGNHYHENKDENVQILAGRGTVYLRVVSSMNEHPVSELYTFQLNTGDTMRVAPFEAHAFVLEVGSIMICRSIKPYNPHDSHHFELVKRQTTKG